MALYIYVIKYNVYNFEIMWYILVKSVQDSIDIIPKAFRQIGCAEECTGYISIAIKSAATADERKNTKWWVLL